LCFLFLLCLLGHVLFWYVFVELACIMANSSCYYCSCDRNSHILVNVRHWPPPGSRSLKLVGMPWLLSEATGHASDCCYCSDHLSLFFWHLVSLFFLFTENLLDLIPKPYRVISQFYKILGFRTLAH
jgi:hypothetical protein